MTTLRNLALALANGYILMFYSELAFWSRPRPGDSLAGWLETWGAYSLMGYIFLAAVRHFRVRERWALFLCGALFGWLGEGVIVQTMYDSFPLQISWTGLAWHALISVWFGWQGMRLALAGGRPGRLAWINLAFGTLWGFWAIFWWYEDPAHIAGLTTFGLYAFISAGLLALAYLAFDRLRPAAFRPGRWPLRLAIGLFLALFLLAALTTVPLALAVLPPLVAVLLLALGRNRRSQAEGSLLEAPGGPIPVRRYAAILLAPLAAAAFYAAARLLPWHLPTGWAVYFVTTPAGAILFVLAVLRVWRRKPLPSPAADGASR